MTSTDKKNTTVIKRLGIVSIENYIFICSL